MTRPDPLYQATRPKHFNAVRRPASQQTPTLADVANALGVSTATVSRVVNGTGHVSETTRARVQVAINALGYVPNAHARSLKQRANVKVALLTSIPNDSYIVQLLEGALDEAAQQNVQLLFRRGRALADPLKEAQSLLKFGVNGFLLTPPFTSLGTILELIEEAGAERVVLGHRSSQAGLSAVGIDDEAAAYEMTVHLIALGHRKIGFIIGDECHSVSRYRLVGYRRALADHSIAQREDFEVQGKFTFESGLIAARQLLSLNDRPTAIFASNDDMAAGAINAAVAQGLHVPVELTVCGFDDTVIAETITPGLTTIRQPVRAIAAEGLKLLLRRISRSMDSPAEPSQQILLGFDLIRRNSDGPPMDVPAEVFSAAAE